MVSAMGQEKLVKDSIIAGAKGFIVKPFKEDKLIEALEKL
jgi:two-component system chemotaxis response regulator CheY